jgi:hypothetical protein
MGGASSRRRNKKTPIPTYTPGAGTPGISRPGSAFPSSLGNTSPVINRDQQLMQLNQTVATLNNQLQALQRGGVGVGSIGTPQMPYGGYPGGVSPPMPYGGYRGGNPPVMPYGGYPGGAPPIMPYGTPPSPLLQHFGGMYSHQQQPMMGGGGGGGVATYRDTDFGAIANIAGLNPADVALLHREFMNLTRGGTSKIDRVIFRQILRDVLLQANNEQVDRVIENMFITIDRNHDGFIDFPEFVGAFKDVLKQGPSDPQSYFEEHVVPDVLSEQLRASGVGSGIAPRPIAYIPQAQPAAQLVSPGGLNIVPLASMGIQQTPIMYGGAAPLQISDAAAPLITLDPSQSSYVIATPGQYLITQPTALQFVPLPMM